VPVLIELEVERAHRVAGLLHRDREVGDFAGFRIELRQKLLAEMRVPDHAVGIDDHVVGLGLPAWQVVFGDDDLGGAGRVEECVALRRGPVRRNVSASLSLSDQAALADQAVYAQYGGDTFTSALLIQFDAVTGEVRVVDAVTFIAERVLPGLTEHPRLESLTVHPTCSSTQLGINDALHALAREVAEEVVVPQDWGCCAFAGDRGMLHPELTASATAGQAAEVLARPTEAHASCNRTCELAMTRATGRPYRHVIEILADLVSTPPNVSTSPVPANSPQGVGQ